MATSFVVCAYRTDRVEFAREAIRSALAQSPPPEEVILVVDRVEGPRRYLEADLPGEVRIVENLGGRGLSNARNTGVLASSGELIAFLDDDAVAAPDWLHTLTAHFRDPLVIGAGGRALPVWLGDGLRPFWLPEEFDWVVGCTYKGFADTTRYVRNIHGSNMCFRRTAFDQVGLFSPVVGGPVAGDDTELCLRILMRPEGFRIVYDPAAVVHHKVPRERQRLLYFISNSFDEGRGKGLIRLLHPRQSVALSSERTYLRQLLRQFFPSRGRQLLGGDWRSGMQMALGALSIASVALGHMFSQMYDGPRLRSRQAPVQGSFSG